MKTSSTVQEQMPLDIAGSSIFGRDPKIMASRTFNMILADGWFIDYFGYKNIINLEGNIEGRGIFRSTPSNVLISCIDNKIYVTFLYSATPNGKKNFFTRIVGYIDSFSGDVFFDENNTGQVAICDQHNLYIYNTIDNSFKKAVLPEGFVPGYVTYQDGRFIVPDRNSNLFALSQVGDGLNWFWSNSAGPVLGALQTKADKALVTLRVPGRGNLLFVMGKTVTELYTDVGATPIPYKKSSSINIDYGCANPATVAATDEFVIWLGFNEKSGPVIMYSSGAEAKSISTDGINYRISTLNNPEKSTGFLIKLSGHLCYQLTFYDPSDNYSLVYDLTEQKFYDVTDEKMNYHICRRVAFWENDYYFVSLNDGNVYQLSPSMNTLDYGKFSDNSPKVYDIPRIRVCSNIRFPNSFRFVINNLTFIFEQGNDIDNNLNNPDYFPNISLSFSKNGGISFGSYSTRRIYQVGKRINRLNWWGLGIANDFVPQFRFNGKGPIKATNGTVSLYQ